MSLSIPTLLAPIGGFRYSSKERVVGSLLGLYHDLRWRPDKAPRQCVTGQVAQESANSLALLTEAA